MRIYNLEDLSCAEGVNAIKSEDDIDDTYETVKQNEVLFFGSDIIDGPKGLYEDFKLDTSGRITAINLYGGDTLTFSQQPDLYEYRVLKRNATSGRWALGALGPFLDKTVDQTYVCLGLNYVGSQMTEEEGVSYGDYLLVVAIRGPESEYLNLTTTGHFELTTEAKGADFIYGSHMDPESRVGFYEKNTFKSIRFRISQNLDVFSHELQQKDLAMFTAAHPMN